MSTESDSNRVGPAAALAAVGLQSALRAYLSTDPQARSRFAELEGSAFGVELVGVGITLYILPVSDGIKVVTALGRDPDVVISGSPFALARLAGGELTGSGVRFSGDTSQAQRLRDLLAGVDFDWEEPLAQVVGDVAAHQIGIVFRGGARWGTELLRSLVRDTDEYLHEERRDVPPREEVERFLEEVDDFRSDVDRLEARLEYLLSTLTETDRR